MLGDEYLAVESFSGLLILIVVWDSWVWILEFRLLDLDFWICISRLDGFLGLASWDYIPEFGFLVGFYSGLVSCVRIHGSGMLGLESRA